VSYYSCEEPYLVVFFFFFFATFSVHVGLFSTMLNSWTNITLFTLVLLRPLGGVIFILGPGMYFQTGQVIFVPEWPKGEFVSL